MSAIVSTEAAVLEGDVWVTWHTGSDGSRFATYERNDEHRNKCGCRNNAKHGDVPLGLLHPNCVACHEHGYCKSMCPPPVDLPGFTCTVEMEPEDQEAGWLVGPEGWHDGYRRDVSEGS